MQPELNGVFEKVNFTGDSLIRLYQNREYEDYPVHWHTAAEIIMPIENTYSVTMNKTLYRLREGDILIIPPGELHELFAPPTGERIILLFDFTLVSNLKGFSNVLPILMQPRLITAENYPDIYEQEKNLLTSITKEYQSKNTLWEAIAYSMIIQMFVLAGRSCIGSSNLFADIRTSRQKEYIDKFNKVFQYVDQNYTEEISLETAAKIAGFSKFHFSRLFKQFTDTSFYDCLNLRRVQAAEHLLLIPGLPITEIALQCGFSSISTFNRVFKSFKKCTPSEFRELYQNYK